MYITTQFLYKGGAALFWRWQKINERLSNNLCNSSNWKDLDVDENFKDWQTICGKFEEIEAVVNAAFDGQTEDSVANLLHWAARCNKTWVISQFLKDTEHVNLMALDVSGRTALGVAEAYGSKEAAAMLEAHFEKQKQKNRAITLTGLCTNFLREAIADPPSILVPRSPSPS
jgi:hypothetical protein